MGKIVCVVNQKGGVGKTTTAVNLAAAMAIGQQRCVLVDMDPQCNATGAVGAEPLQRHALLGDDDVIDVVLPCVTRNLSILPGARSFEDVARLVDDPARVAAGLDKLREHFDFVLIDCPPSVADLTQTALAASDEVLIPIQCEYFAMEGLAEMVKSIAKVIQSSKGRLTFGGIVLTMYDPRLELTQEVDSDVRDFFGDIVFDTVIPRDVSLGEAPSHGQTVFQYAPRSRGAYAYTQLCMEVLQRD